MPHNVTLDIVVAEDALGIDIFNYTPEFPEMRVEFLERIWTKLMSLGPVGAALISTDNILVSLEEFPVWHVIAVRS